jgi:hypothetical protein
MPAASAEGFLANVAREPKGTVLDENLANGLSRLSWMLPLYVVGSLLAGTAILLSATGFTTIVGFTLCDELPTMVLSLWPTLQSLLGEPYLLAAPIIMLFLLAVSGGLTMFATE